MTTHPDGLPPGCRARFRPLEVLGRGGFGTVIRAEQITLARMAAIKVLDPDVMKDPQQILRFQEEARITAALRHPNIVELIDSDIEDGVPWIAFELVPGRPLSERRNEGPMEVTRVLEIGRQVASGLAAAHARGIVHRDVKPENTLEGPDGSVKILDFGIAKWNGQARVKTAAGMLFGTPPYMANECFGGGASHPRWDVYALGVMLIELRLGRSPFPGELGAIVKAKRDDKALEAAIASAGLPGHVGAALGRLVATDPDRRPATGAEALELLEGLSEAATTPGRSARREPSAAAPASTLPVTSITPTRARPWRTALTLCLAAVSFLAGRLSRDPTGPSPGPPPPPPGVTVVTEVPPSPALEFVVDRTHEINLRRAPVPLPPLPEPTHWVAAFFDPRSGASMPERVLLELSFRKLVPSGVRWPIELNGSEIGHITASDVSAQQLCLELPIRKIRTGVNRIVIRDPVDETFVTHALGTLRFRTYGARPARPEDPFYEGAALPPFPPELAPLLDGQDIILPPPTEPPEVHLRRTLEAVRTLPGNPYAYRMMGFTLERAGRHPEAFDLDALATDLGELNAWILHDTARVLCRLQRDAEAVLLFRAGLRESLSSRDELCEYQCRNGLLKHRDRITPEEVKEHSQVTATLGPKLKVEHPEIDTAKMTAMLTNELGL